MKLISLKCPHCQGTLDIKKEERGGFTVCPFCGTKFFLEEEQPNINQTINIKEVHIGNTGKNTAPKDESPKNITAALRIVIFIVFIFIFISTAIAIFTSILSQHNIIYDIGSMMPSEVLTPESAYEYRTVPESKAVKEFVEIVFKKPLSEITNAEYASIKYLKIRRQPVKSISSKTADTPWLFTYAKKTGEYGTPVKPDTITIKGTETIIAEDIQVFTGLESLDFSNESDINPVVQYDTVDFGNLKNLHYYTGSSGESLKRLPLFYDMENIYGLGSTYVDDEEYLTELKKFTKLKTLSPRNINKNFAKDLTFLASFPDLEKLSLSFSSGETWDLAGLSALTKLRTLSINGFDTKFEHFNVFSGMPQLEEIAFDDVKDLKTLDFVKNMPNLKSLSIEDCPIISLNGLKNSVSLTELSLDGCHDLSDVSALATLTSLKSLDIAYIWNFDLKYPKLNKLTALSNVKIESGHLDIISGLKSIKKLFIYETSDYYSFKPLLGLKELTEVELQGYNWAQKEDMAQCLSKLPKLRTLVFGYDCLAHYGDYTDIFSLPQVTKLQIQPYDTGSSYINLSIKRLKKNSVLKELDTGGAEIYNLDTDSGTVEKLGVYANKFLSCFPKLKKLNVSHSHIQDLEFVSKTPDLEVLNISDNYVTDISKLLELKKLKSLTCDKGQIVNLDLLPKKIQVNE